MRRARQLSLIKEPRRNTKLWWIAKQHVYGGSMNYRKVARPFDSKKLTHAVFKARLGSALRFTKSTESIRKLLNRVAHACDVKISDSAINHDHIHLLFACKRRKNQTRFLRLFAAEMGRRYKTVKKKFGVRFSGSIWVHRPFTRLVSWSRRTFQTVRSYFAKNRKEALGFIEYAPRKHRLSMFLKQWESRFTSSA